jgi:hypothetical protein
MYLVASLAILVLFTVIYMLYVKMLYVVCKYDLLLDDIFCQFKCSFSAQTLLDDICEDVV